MISNLKISKLSFQMGSPHVGDGVGDDVGEGEVVWRVAEEVAMNIGDDVVEWAEGVEKIEAVE